MKIKHMKKAVGTLVLAVVSSSMGAISAGSSDASENSPTRVINESGWEIAGLSASRIVAARKPLEELGSGAAHITMLKPRTEVITKIPIFWLTDSGATLHTRQQGIAIRSIHRYDFDGHVFCYALLGVGSFYDEKTRRGGYGGEFILIYYDNDGDGKFESFEIGNSARSFTPTLPAWVLKNRS